MRWQAAFEDFARSLAAGIKKSSEEAIIKKVKDDREVLFTAYIESDLDDLRKLLKSGYRIVHMVPFVDGVLVNLRKIDLDGI